MSKKPKYRLQGVLDQREQAKKDAERELGKSNKQLAHEKEKLVMLEQKRRETLARIDKARRQRSEKALKNELTVQESRQFKMFIQGLHEERKELDLQIYKQAKAVERAQEQVEKAKNTLIQKAKEFEAMSKHRQRWFEAWKMEEQKKEQKVMEEIGMIQFLKRQGEKKDGR